MVCRALVLLCGVVGVASAVNPAVAADDDTNSTAPVNPATAQELPNVVVIGTAPVRGIGVPPEEVAANVQAAGSEDVKRQHPLTLADYLNNNFSGINIS